MSQDNGPDGDADYPSANSAATPAGDKNDQTARSTPAPQSTSAEQDMELIKAKRLTSTQAASGNSGAPKSKYRKRSRATPPGKCHSCNIRETPEWRRGPDGARTLCNACGLHYAKMMRRKDKNGGDIKIDMETLRASARAAENANNNANNAASGPSSS
ncbi:GATA-domain-containing protein, partial [Coprinopsis marcescibilis]